MVPVWVSALPLATVFLGCLYAYVFVWPLPFCAESYWKKPYLFLLNKWGFDIVWNQQIRLKVLQAGSVCWASLDKGVLELIGPRGITQKVSGWLVPSTQKMQTGAVNDYALLLQILIVVGFTLLAFPADSWTESLLLESKTIALAVLLASLSLSFTAAFWGRMSR
jgi:NADH:ubiquinone oxidoreductase subunit 5 (subunit L)/multisubunit Na+/H+ antiporter MnhA subunit